MGDHVRRWVGVLLAASVLLVAPQVAEAAFSGTAEQQLSVGTATMVAPTTVASSSRCRYFFFSRTGVTVNVDGFTDNGPAGASYSYRLTRPNGEVLAQDQSTARSSRLTTNTGMATYRLTIQATLGNWTGPAYSETISC